MKTIDSPLMVKPTTCDMLSTRDGKVDLAVVIGRSIGSDPEYTDHFGDW